MKITVTEKGRNIQNEILKEGNYKNILPKLNIKTSGFQSKPNYDIIKHSSTFHNITSPSKSQTNQADPRKFDKRRPPALQLAEICNYGIKSVALSNNNYLPQEELNMQTLTNSRLNNSKKGSPITSEIFFEISRNKEENSLTNLLNSINSPEKKELAKNNTKISEKEKNFISMSKIPELPQELNRKYSVFKENKTLRHQPESQNSLKKALSSTMLMSQYDRLAKDNNNNTIQFETKISRFRDKYVKDQFDYNYLVETIRTRVKMKKLEASQQLTSKRDNISNLLKESEVIFEEINQMNDGYRQRKKEKLKEYMLIRYKDVWKNSQADRYLSGKPLKINKLAEEKCINNPNESSFEAYIAKLNCSINSTSRKNPASKILDF